MTIRECYEKMGSDYDAVLERIPSEAIITKFAKKFIDDASYSNLENAMTQCRGSFQSGTYSEGNMS